LNEPDQVRELLRATRYAPELRRLPALLKISPDLDEDEIAALTDLALEEGAAGIVATNTSARMAGARGGLSGAPLRARSTEVIRQVRRRAGAALTIIGVGGVFTAADVLEKILAGASLVQVYTGFIYRGPVLLHELHQELPRLLRARGFASVGEAVGAEATRRSRAAVVAGVQ
jgi:dihydroorotate dehydrogenase